MMELFRAQAQKNNHACVPVFANQLPQAATHNRQIPINLLPLLQFGVRFFPKKRNLSAPPFRPS